MKKYFLYIIVSVILTLLFLTGCKFDRKGQSVFDGSIQYVDSVRILTTNAGQVVAVPLPLPTEKLHSSEVVKEVSYLFLETTPESLIGQYNEIVVYKNRIYILDYIVTENVFIFDISGKFIGKMPKGNGPDEFIQVRGMFIDKIRDQLIVYDAERFRFVYCSLDGKPLGKKVDVQLYFPGMYAVARSGEIIYLTERSLSNPHVEKLDNYRLLYTDTLGRITKAAFSFDDNKNIPAALSRFDNGNGELLFYAKYTSDIYRLTEDAMTLKYRVDLSDFTPISLDEIRSLHSSSEMSECEKKGTFMTSHFSETDTHLYFSVEDKRRFIFAFYDKRSKRTVSFHDLIFDSDIALNFPNIFSVGSHFVGFVLPPKLKQMAEYRRRDGHPLNKELEEKIANLKEDDNSPLVLFTLK